jgi:ubiquinone/menaquinone biosynthesis C-methylase UbiE
VTLLAVLEHMEHREELLKEIYRVLKPGGVLLLTVPTWPAKPVLEFLAYRLKVVSDEAIREHKTYFWKKELRDILSLVQFKPEMTQVRYFELGFNLFAAARK